jgi:predicted dehydrogenase
MFNETEKVAAVIADFLYDENQETKDCESFISFATARDARFRTSNPSADDDDSFSVYLIFPPGRCRLGEGKSAIACTSAIPKGMHAGYRCIIVFESGTLTATFIDKNQTTVDDIPIADLPAICPDLFFSPRYFTNRAREKTVTKRN